MSNYQIVCVTKHAGHGHIEGIGTDAGPGYHHPLSVQDVYNLIDAGNSFHTGSMVRGNYATVAKFSCTTCGRPTLRSHADREWNNNLDNLVACGV